MTTTVQRWGNSQAVRIPKTILESLFMKENDKVVITADNDSIIIRKATRKRRANKSLDERFSEYKGNHICTEYDWGDPAGNEVW
jgi:antitoxin MazE